MKKPAKHCQKTQTFEPSVQQQCSHNSKQNGDEGLQRNVWANRYNGK